MALRGLGVLWTSVLLTLLLYTAAWAHTLFMSVQDNDDGTVLVQGMYSTGALAARTPVRLVGGDGKTLREAVTDDAGECVLEKPAESYTIILDGGEGHRVEQPGPAR